MSRNEKNNKTSLTKSIIDSPKRLLTASAILSLMANVITLVVLIVSGYAFDQYIIPLILLVVDALFLLAVLTSNFRFRYSMLLPILYIIFTIIGALIMWIINGVNTLTVRFTLPAMCIWLVLHGVSCVAVIVSALRAGKFGANGKRFKILALVCVVALVGAVGMFGYSTITSGLYGQGVPGERRTIEYTFDELKDYYRVTGVMQGRGDTVVVPAQFNGKPVCEVDCSVFADKSIKNVYFDNATIKLNNSIKLITDKTEGRKIYVDKNDCDAFREQFFQHALIYKDKDYMRIADSTLPTNLDKNEVYVTFSYDWEDFIAVNGATLDTWFAKKGTVLTNASLSGAKYATKFDVENSDNLYWSYDNLDKRIYNGVYLDNAKINGKSVNESKANVKVKFDELYEIIIVNDNDNLYETSNDFKYKTYEGQKRNRIVTKAMADDFIGSIDKRSGFSLEWKYGDNKKTFSSLSTVISDGLEICPHWTLNRPVIQQIATTAINGTSIYGDSVFFTSSATSPDYSINLRYEWKKSGVVVATSNDWSNSCVKPSDTGSYVLTVTAYSNTLTSLTSSVSGAVSLTVNKRSLDFDWILPQNATYSAQDKPIYCDYKKADVINNDAITFSLDRNFVKDVGDYTFNLTLTGECNELYEIPSEDKTASFTVVPYNITAIWRNTLFTYNTQNQAPSASAIGLGADGELDLTIEGAKKNAGVDYIAMVSTSNTNYNIINPTQKFTIQPYEVEAKWGSATFTYNASNQHPTASATGLGSDMVAVKVDGAKRDVGNYTATAISENDNYVIKNNTYGFEIFPFDIAVEWGNSTLTYNANNQHPTASAKGVGSDGQLDLTVSGAKKDVGSDYIARVITSNNNYTITNPMQSFTIMPYSIAVKWSNTSLVYNANNQSPTASATGLGADGQLDLTISGTRKDAGDYTAIVTTSNANYTIINPEQGCVIKPYGLTVEWGNTLFSYDKAFHKPTATATALSSDVINISVSGEKIDAGNYTAVASVDNSNYSINNATTSFSIEKLALTLEWNDSSFKYDGSEHPVSVKGIMGELSGDESEILSGLKYSAKSVKNVGSTNIVVTLSNEGVSKNYYIKAGATCVCTVSPALLSLNWSACANEYQYSGAVKTVQADVSGIMGADTNIVKFEYFDNNGACSNNQAINAGEYTVRAKIIGNNYVFTQGTVTEFSFKISPISITTQADKTEFIYNGNAQTPVVTASDDNAELVLSYYKKGESQKLSGAPKDIGEYTVVVSVKGNNYSILQGFDSIDFEIVESVKE
ncbi:MAG: hypothetical protein E7353_05800 [Clostridiales bacterium]|nr:hypothetical protein [Clostridiales bacterium]